MDVPVTLILLSSVMSPLEVATKFPPISVLSIDDKFKVPPLITVKLLEALERPFPLKVKALVSRILTTCPLLIVTSEKSLALLSKVISPVPPNKIKS